MKLHLKNIVLTAGLSALLGTATLGAQELKAVADIPFAYQAGQKTLSAGKYTLHDTGTRGIFLLREYATSHAIFVSGTPHDTGRGATSKLVFSCYGHDCSLSQIWIQGDGFQLKQPRVEREASNHLGVVALVSVPLLSR